MADAEVLRLMPDVERGDIDAMRKVATIVQAKYGFHVVERTVMPAGAAAFFNWDTRTATVPPITDAESFAVRLHEFGHGIAGKCPQREPHRRDLRVTAWWNCVPCENAGWFCAGNEVPFTLPMFRRTLSSRCRESSTAAVR